jgi:hypothetical protein
MTCRAIYWQKARTKSKDIDGSDRLIGGCLCQSVNSDVCHILMKLEFSRQNFEKKNSSFNFYENASSGSLVVPWGRTNRQTDMEKLIVAFQNFVNAPNNALNFQQHYWYL